MRAASVVAVGLVAACSSRAPTEPVWSADPAASANPLPDDRLRTASGLAVDTREGYWLPFTPVEALNPTLESHYRDYAGHIGDLSGWGTYAPILIAFTRPLDPATVTAEHFAIVPIDAGAQVPAYDVLWHANPGYVELQPRTPFQPMTGYGVAVRAGVRDADGDAVAFAAERSDDEVTAVAPALGATPDTILLAFTFTTGDSRGDMQAAAALLAEAVPTYDLTEVPNNPRWPRGVYTPAEFLAAIPPGELHDDLAIQLASAGRVVVGTYGSRDFRDAGGVFDPAFLDGTAEAPSVNVEFVLVEPDPAVHPPPWPTTVVQHGFQGQEIDVLTRARPFNDEGIATIGIDAVSHGQRGNVAGFLDPQDLRKVRENFRQTVLDQLQVCRLAVAAGIDVDGQPGADLARECFYIGQSMGGVLGGVFAALSLDTEVAVLDVPGGGLTHILSSPTLGPIVAILFQSALGLTGRDQAWADNLPFFSWLGQTTLDASDPINYGAVARDGHPSGRARRVLLQAGVGDSLVPNETTTALATTMGVPELAGPVDDAAGVSGVWWVDLADYGIQSVPGGDLDPHNILNLLPGVERQGAIYMRSGGTSVVDPHTVNDPYE